MGGLAFGSGGAAEETGGQCQVKEPRNNGNKKAAETGKIETDSPQAPILFKWRLDLLAEVNFMYTITNYLMCHFYYAHIKLILSSLLHSSKPIWLESP